MFGGLRFRTLEPMLRTHETTPPDPSTGSTSTPPVAAAAERATKVYGAGPTAVRALDEATVHIPSGRLTAIMGPSASGKSTLLQSLPGLDTLTAVRVTIGDADLA
jgi:putative ABC transport system ATP-binding protein